MLTHSVSFGTIALLSEKVANGLGNLFSKGAIAMCHKVHGFFYIYPSMMGVIGSRKACRLLCPVYQPITSIARCLVTSSGGLKTTAKELVMSQHNYTQTHHAKNPLTLSVSETKLKSLLAQVSIIRSAINIHGITQTQENFNTLKSDALELVRMLDEIEPHLSDIHWLLAGLADLSRQVNYEADEMRYALDKQA
jgi:hypothetical protein